MVGRQAARSRDAAGRTLYDPCGVSRAARAPGSPLAGATPTMITKFTTVYPGHVDLPDRGQNATPVNERRFSNEHLAGVFAKTEAIARTLDKHGYDTLWLAEHHFQHEGYEVIPNLLMVAVHLAHVTRT